MNSKKTKPVLLFDVNETLLDMTPLKDAINTLLDEPMAFKIWFGMVLHHSLVDNCTNQYHDFSTIAVAMLKMTATSLNKTITDDETKKTLSVIRNLKAYPDVLKGLQLLKENGFRLATLTNSPENALKEQLINSNLTDIFELALSIDTLKKYKPDPQTYKWAATQLDQETQNIIMIAAHGWDLAGAMNAGLKTGFIAREGQSLYSLSDNPNYVAKDIYEMALVLTEKYK
ncbi:haloacid dehalogenase type II [Flavobacterium sp. W20_MBD1_R3]|uniref:haloacid dehalogenase type II n=1 Tax=Flavobacterium sp. W20_MBD1_R3 TaxID=3240278 RepID=UPI003F930CC6